MAIWDGMLDGTTFHSRVLPDLWDCLSTESKVELLQQFNHRMRSPPEDIVRKALQDPHAYIRFLAGIHGIWRRGSDEPLPTVEQAGSPQAMLEALRRRSPRRDPVVDEAIANDTSALARSALAVNRSDADGFQWMIDAPHLERLAHIALGGTVSGDFLVDFVRSAVGKVPDLEIAGVLLEYCHSPVVREQFAADTTDDAMTDFTAKGWFDKVWGLVGTVPETVYRPLLSYMPTEVLNTWEVPDEVIARMDEDDLRHLVRRSDAKLPRLRRRIEENPEQFPAPVLEAAAEWEAWMPRLDEMAQLRQRLDAIEASLQSLVQKKRSLFG